MIRVVAGNPRSRWDKEVGNFTVGWKMSVLIEKTYGRARLIECFCDQRKLLSTYNQAAEKHNRRSRDQYALWSNSLITRVQNGKSQTN